MKAQLIDVSFENKRTIQLKKVDKFYLDNPFHFHHLCELVWIEESYGKRVVGDNVDNFTNGDLVLMSPNLPHIWQNDPIFFHKKKGFRSKATVIYFPEDIIKNLSDESDVVKPVQDLFKKASRGMQFYGDTNKKVAAILQAINQTTGLQKIIHLLNIIEILASSKEYELLASVSYKNEYDEKDASRIASVYQFLIHNFHRNITLQEVAAVSNMSPTAFCRFFKSRTQKSFVEFLNELRIGHAVKLLQNEEYSIADACYESGYNNLANFNKFFKAVKGKTPSEYRKSILDSQEIKH